MRHFMKMVEVAKNKGVKSIRSMEKRDSKLDARFFDAVKKNEIFIFSKTKGETKSLPELGNELVPLDFPFPVFSYEMVGDFPLTSSDPTAMAEHGVDIRILCVMLEEIAPKKGVIYMLIETVFADGYSTHEVTFTTEEDEKPITAMTKIYLARLGQEKTGAETVKEKIKIGIGKNKHFHKISKVIHVTPHRLIANTESFSREINWSHRWSVRGHWRIQKGVGKNRVGEYCVNGFTWVESHTKGPEDMPVIKKQRVVT